MKLLSYDYRIPSRSTAAVYDAFEDAVKAMQRTRVIKFDNRKVSAEAILNSIVMHFLDMDVEARKRLVSEYVPKLEALLVEQDTPKPAKPVVHTDAGDLHPVTPKAKRPRRSQG